MALKPSDRVTLTACALGTLCGLGLWWALPAVTGWGALIVGALVAAAAYKGLLDQTAKTTIIDHLPRK